MIYTKNNKELMPEEPVVPSGNTAEGGSAASSIEPVGAGTNAEAGATNPPYFYEIVRKEGGLTWVKPIVSLDDPYADLTGVALGEFSMNPMVFSQKRSQIYPPPPPPAAETTPAQTTQNQTAAPDNPANSFDPLDPRLVFITESTDNVPTLMMSYSWDPAITAPLVEGFVYADKNGSQAEGEATPIAVGDSSVERSVIYDDPKLNEFIGVPALMSNMSYINFIGSGGKDGIKNLVDRENSPRWYDVTADSPNGTSSTSELTVTNLIKWGEKHKRFPYRYTDFVFLKWWKKIPLNYMITLRRYTRPVIDNVTTEFDSDYQGKNELKLRSAVHAITFLGEDPGNKISSILGPIEAGLLWKEVKADVWEVTTDSTPGQADSPFPNLAKTLGFLNKGPVGAKDSQPGQVPPDPYSNGPYANKILGPVTVIDSTKARARGVKFKHDLNLVFEYTSRSIGGINSKAAMLDILSNLLILTYNTATFWGGMNRHMPHAGAGGQAPFLGGAAGRKAWMQGNPAAFFEAVSKQFEGAMANIGDLFNKLFDDPVAGLKSMAAGAMSNYMKMNSTAGRSQTQGIHSLLTGAPVGEWHVTVGNPMNPMMMIGNMICSGIKIEFNDELGPDDFPTELKATITLEHGMPRDKTDIESMFNKGGGRLYSLPPKMNESDLFASMGDSIYGKVDTPNYVNNGSGGQNGGGGAQPGSTRRSNNSGGKRFRSKNPLLGDPTQIDKIVNTWKNSTVPRISATMVGIYNHGFAAYTRATTEKKK